MVAREVLAAAMEAAAVAVVVEHQVRQEHQDPQVVADSEVKVRDFKTYCTFTSNNTFIL